MKTFFIHFLFIQLAIGASLRTRKAVSITLNAAKAIPISGLKLTDINKAFDNLLNPIVHSIVPASDGYIGCYKDDSNRLLKHRKSNLGNSMTLAKGREHCKGYTYMGLQYGSYIFCGNILANKNYPRVPESDCNMACAGEKYRMCGSSNRNSIYLVKL